jgi:hypothetical protein
MEESMAEFMPRFRHEMNMLVVRMTPSEAKEARRIYDEEIARREGDGRINALNSEVMYKEIWKLTHFGADAVEEVPEGTLLETIDAPI